MTSTSYNTNNSTRPATPPLLATRSTAPAALNHSSQPSGDASSPSANNEEYNHPTIVSLPVQVSDVERHFIVQVVQYRKTLMCMALIDLFFCLLNMMSFSIYIFGLVLILFGYYGALTYNISCSQAYICYNATGFFMKMMLLLLLISSPASYAEKFQNSTLDNDPQSTDSPHESSPDIPFYTYLFVICDTLITGWIARIGCQFTYALKYLENNSLVYERFRSGQYQVIQNQPWQRDYIW